MAQTQAVQNELKNRVVQVELGKFEQIPQWVRKLLCDKLCHKLCEKMNPGFITMVFKKKTDVRKRADGSVKIRVSQRGRGRHYLLPATMVAALNW